MEGSSSGEEMARQNLLDRILNSVKQVQAHFGAKQEIATESDSRVSAMCIEWEAVLTHAAKKPKPKNSLRLTGRQEAVTLWPLARLSVSVEDLQRFSRLEHVHSEVGRGRAWLRAAINERTLETYLHIILGQEEELRKLYEGHAFVLDQERSSMLPIMAAGLSSIIFSIAVDVSYLNTASHSAEATAATSRQLEPPEAMPPSSHTNSSRNSSSSDISSSKKKNSSSPRHSTSNLGPGSSPRQSTSNMGPGSSPRQSTSNMGPGSSPRQSTSNMGPGMTGSSMGSGFQPHPLPVPNKFGMSSTDDDDVIAVNAKKKKGKRSKSSKSSGKVGSNMSIDHGTPESTSPSPGSPDSQRAELQADRDRETLGLRESASSSSSRLSLDVIAEDSPAPTFVALPAPAVSSDVEIAIDATAQLLSSISQPLPDREEEQFSVGTTRQTPPLTVTPPYFKETTPPQEGVSDIKSAMLAVSKIKDELATKNKELTDTVLHLEQRIEVLTQEAEQARQSSVQMQEAHSGKLQALERENDLLREQLKKYLAMVQSQWKDSSTKQPSSLGLDVATEHAPVTDGPYQGEEPDQSESNTTNNHLTPTDHKLQQMAEMYADLMELNERLHRDLADKDAVIGTLVRSLKESSLELPVPVHQLPPSAMETKALVDVWIPSVIKKGRGPDGYHVYQIFVSVKAVEWNIYRRYTEFREFHRQLQKHIPELASFNFPPKKALGRKNAQVVEERRVRLQDYLRFVIKTCSSSRKGKGNKEKLDPVITSAITKATLVTMFPFFKEDFNTESSSVLETPSYSGL